MMKGMGKLTETFNDRARAATANGAVPLAPAPVHVEATHEPLRSEPFTMTTPFVLPTGSPVADSAVMPAPEPAPLKVALIGTAPSSRMLAPFNDPSYEIWACSPGNMNMLPRVTKWFEIHGNLMWPEHASYGPAYVEWLKQQQFPVYMQDQSLVPNALTFPKDQLVAKFGRDFFTSSFAWMMALAIDMGAKEIALFGIDMASRNEYILQRPGFYHFRFLAQERGIKVWAPNESDIMQPPGLYGYSEVTPFGRKIIARKVEIQQRLQGLRTQRDQLNHQIIYLEGAEEDLDYIESIWSSVQS